MKVLIFGATGMVGQGVVRECLLDRDIEQVVTIGRSATEVRHAKLKAIVHADLLHYEGIGQELSGCDACFFCLGTTLSGKSEEEYVRLTYGITIAAAECLSARNPAMTFVYVSGAGADSSENGRVMWARVRGRTENALFRLPFRAVYVFRPAAIVAAHGEQSKTPAYRISYNLMRPLLPLLRRLFRGYFLTTEELAKAMIQAVKRGAPKKIMESADIGAYIR